MPRCLSRFGLFFALVLFPLAIQAFAQDAYDRSDSRDRGRFCREPNHPTGARPLHNLLKAAEQIVFRRPVVS
jgi:hypothetical protein